MGVPCARTEPKQNLWGERKCCSDNFVLLLVVFLVTCKINWAFSVYSASGITIKKKIVHVQYIWREWSWKHCFRKCSHVQKKPLFCACKVCVLGPGFQSTVLVPRGPWFTGFLRQLKIVSLMSLLIAKEMYLNCFSERIKHIIKRISEFFLIIWSLFSLSSTWATEHLCLSKQTIHF